MKRFVVVMTVWAMGLAGVLAGVVLPTSASASSVAPVVAAATDATGAFTPLPTARVFDGMVNTSSTVIGIVGKGGVPVSATAVMVNTEVFAPTAAGYVRVTPYGSSPSVATQQFVKGQAISNLVAVKLVNGAVQVKVSAGSARILMDVSGYYGGSTAGSKFTPLPTARVFDGTVSTKSTVIGIVGKGGVPVNATAVMVNTEVFNPTAAGYVRVTPAGSSPGVATQQFGKGRAISSLVAVKLVNGALQVKVSAGSARILMDVAGYYGPTAAESFTPLPTARVFDGKATTTSVPVLIAGAKPGGVPANATAVLINTEVFAPTAAGYVRVTPAGSSPGVATQQFVKGQAISNLVAVKLVGGKLQVKMSAGSARILMDVAGYYADETPPGPVTGLNADVATADSITLNWTDPLDEDFAGVTIRRLEGSVAPTINTGIVVADTAQTPFTDLKLKPGTEYSYALFSKDGVPNYATAATVTQTTGELVSISGKVTDAAFHGLEFVQVTVSSESFTYNTWNQFTDHDGNYAVKGLPAGTDYKVCFFPSGATGGPLDALGYLSECYADTTLIVADGVTTTGIDAHVLGGGAITGKVTGAPGTHGLENVEVNAQSLVNETVEYAITNSEGIYTLNGLVAGAYRVCFDAASATGGTPAADEAGYAPRCYVKEPSLETSTPVEVGLGETTLNIDVALLGRGGSRVA